MTLVASQIARRPTGSRSAARPPGRSIESVTGAVADLAEQLPRPGDDTPVIRFFGDYTCTDTRSAFIAMQQIESLADGKVRAEYRHLVDASNPRATLLAEVAEAARAQGRFRHAHERLFALRPSTMREILATLSGTGVDLELLSIEIHEGTHLPVIETHRREAAAAGVTTPPAIFVEGQHVPSGNVHAIWQVVQQAIRATADHDLRTVG